MVKDSRGGQEPIVFLVLAARGIRNGADVNFDHTLFAGELFRLNRDPVQTILNRENEGQGFKRRAGLSFEIEVRGCVFAERKANFALGNLRLDAVRQVFDAVVRAVVHDFVCAVQRIALYDCGVGRVSVAVEAHIVGLVDRGAHAARHFGDCDKGGLERQDCAEGECRQSFADRVLFETLHFCVHDT